MAAAVDRLRGVDALVFVLDPLKPGVRYEVVRQVYWSYPLFARSKGRILSFVAEGPEARLACTRLVALLDTPHKDLICRADTDFAAFDGPPQVPHPTEPVPSWPNLGLLRPVLEFTRRQALAHGLTMNNKPLDALGRRLMEGAERS